MSETLEYGKTQYLNLLNETNRLAKIQTRQLSLEPQKPSKMPSKDWQEMTLKNQQKITLSEITKRFAAYVKNGYLKLQKPNGTFEKVEFTTESFLQLGFSNLCLKNTEAQIISHILTSCETSNINNPTLEQTVSYCATCMRNSQPIKIQVSQCIGKQPEVRQKKLDYFLQNKTSEIPPIKRFVDKLEAKKWNILRNIVENSQYPVQVEIILGDMDFYTLDGGILYLSEKEKQQLQMEILQLQELTEKQAALYFKNKSANISVRKWSDIYSVSDFNLELEKASEVDEKGNIPWLNNDFKKVSRAPYFRSWGYDKLAEELKISTQEIETFVEQDIIRTAAQYRVEAYKISGIQAWAETSGAPMWPLQISNYNNQGLPPSLVL